MRSSYMHAMNILESGNFNADPKHVSEAVTSIVSCAEKSLAENDMVGALSDLCQAIERSDIDESVKTTLLGSGVRIYEEDGDNVTRIHIDFLIQQIELLLDD